MCEYSHSAYCRGKKEVMGDHGCVPLCQSCGLTFNTMKRCLRCRGVFYCSRECQSRDWGNHKSQCKKSSSDTKEGVKSDVKRSNKLGEIFDSQGHGGNELPFDPAATLQRGPYYIKDNTLCYDVPALDENELCIEVVVKTSKAKVKIRLQHNWSGLDIFKVFACQLKIPFDKLKVIHKGKLLDSESIASCVKPRAMFMVVGEETPDESGVDQQDVKVIMSQLSTDRKTAVLALTKTGNLVDAMLEAGGKQ